ncbi:hypothetical protein CHARACLAT_028177 [Characodon lateralis]|uniref:Prolactin receptor n=1 Tax=Characodon lateralis TaxID=208331 RepID=A0ABU7DUU9_9TELE|nr:hypothetical protein [Characodon lateralis]
MSDMKVEAENPGGISLVSPIPAAPTSELEQKQDSKDLIHKILVIKEEVPHDWSSSLDQEGPEPHHIKEEEEELWISQEEEQLTVKSEEEKPHKSEFERIKTEHDRNPEAPFSRSAVQMKTELDGENCGGPGADNNSDPSCSSQEVKDFRDKLI